MKSRGSTCSQYFWISFNKALRAKKCLSSLWKLCCGFYVTLIMEIPLWFIMKRVIYIYQCIDCNCMFDATIIEWRLFSFMNVLICINKIEHVYNKKEEKFVYVWRDDMQFFLSWAKFSSLSESWGKACERREENSLDNPKLLACCCLLIPYCIIVSDTVDDGWTLPQQFL